MKGRGTQHRGTQERRVEGPKNISFIIIIIICERRKDKNEGCLNRHLDTFP